MTWLAPLVATYADNRKPARASRVLLCGPLEAHRVAQLPLVQGGDVLFVSGLFRLRLPVEAPLRAGVHHGPAPVLLRPEPAHAPFQQLEPGTEPLFVDEPDADLEASPALAAADVPDLERDLVRSDRVRHLVRSELFAPLLYGALCNTLWRHRTAGAEWRCSWRHAGGIVADLRGQGCYTDWYCSMGEGLIDEQVLAEIGALGWELVEANPPDW